MASTMSSVPQRQHASTLGLTSAHTVDIAEPARLALLGVMQAACPVDGNVALFAVEPCRAFHAAAGADAAELKEAVKHGAVVADVVFALLPHMIVHIIGSHLLQKLNVLVRVELRHLGGDGGFCALQGMRVNV